MLVTPIDCIGLARIVFDPTAIAPVPIATYEFANGFETGTPVGATPGSLPIVQSTTPGTFLIFLDTPLDPGTPTNQRGIACFANVSNVTGAPAPAWVTSQFKPLVALLPVGYTLVNPNRVIAISGLTAGGPVAVPFEITLAVFRNALTVYPHP